VPEDLPVDPRRRAPEGPPQGPPKGPPQYARFDGILEGRRDAIGPLEAAVHELRALPGIEADLLVEAGRFSVLLDDRPIRGGAPGQEQLLAALQRLVEASAEPEAVESTLRCTRVYDDRVVETVFAPLRGTMRGVSRVRAVTGEDRERAPRVEPAPGLPRFARRQLAVIVPLVVIAFSLLVWRSGLVDRVFAASATEVTTAAGPFGRMLAVEVGANWGNYEVTVRRGVDYPESADAVRALIEDAVTSADRAAINAVADGGRVFAQLRDDGGTALAFVELELRPLLSAADATVVAYLPGRMSARTVALSLDRGTEGR
jgi:hypothetical protein